MINELSDWADGIYIQNQRVLYIVGHGVGWWDERSVSARVGELVQRQPTNVTLTVCAGEEAVCGGNISCINYNWW